MTATQFVFGADAGVELFIKATFQLATFNGKPRSEGVVLVMDLVWICIVKRKKISGDMAIC